jgi:hypothetical protein
VRWSSAWWKRGELPDVLGCALRFSRLPLGEAAREGDQDLLLATIQRPWTMPLAPLATSQRDFLSNVYYAVSPFELSGMPALGRIDLRLVPEHAAGVAGDRKHRLEGAVANGTARLRLEVASYNGPLRRPDARAFQCVALLTLQSWLDLDQEALRFDPFRTGRGLVPVGFVHALRGATYASSQALRPKQQERRKHGSS